MKSTLARTTAGSMWKAMHVGEKRGMGACNTVRQMQKYLDGIFSNSDILHRCAREKVLKSIGEKYFSESALMQKCNGVSVLEIIVTNGTMEDVPFDKIQLTSTVEELLGITDICTASQDINGNSHTTNNKNLLIPAAKAGNLHKIPEQYLNESSLTTPDSSGWGPIHHASFNGSIRNIPRKLLSEDILNKRGALDGTIAANAFEITQRRGYLDALLGVKVCTYPIALPKSWIEKNEAMVALLAEQERAKASLVKNESHQEIEMF